MTLIGNINLFSAYFAISALKSFSYFSRISRAKPFQAGQAVLLD
jgi:hypothetical protein